MLTPPRRAALRILVACASVGLAVAGMEGALRLLRTDEFLPYHRNSVRLHYPSEAITPGISGVSRFTTNSLGTRGPEPSGERLRLLAIGGSTTACTVLDDTETWPQQLMDSLNQSTGDEKFAWVTNSGIDGHNTHHHLMHARYLVPRIPDLDYALVYAGINDLGMWLFRKDYDPSYLDSLENWSTRLGEAFKVSSYAPVDSAWFRHLELWRRASIVKDRIRSRWLASREASEPILQDAQLEWIERERRRRESTPKVPIRPEKLRTLPAALDSYAHTLSEIIGSLREAGVEPIFMAQAIAHQFLSEEQRRSLWMGAMDGGATYAKEEQMLELLQRFNARMRRVAEEHQVFFIDLPRLIEGETAIFYDFVHFNEKGARTVARAVARELLGGALRDAALDQFSLSPARTRSTRVGGLSSRRSSDAALAEITGPSEAYSSGGR